MNRFLANQVANWQQFAQDAGYSSRDLAKLYGISERHLRRLFRELFDRSPQAMLDEKQLKDAEAALRAFSCETSGVGVSIQALGKFQPLVQDSKENDPSQFLQGGAVDRLRLSA